jgi:hypothetical protein
VLSRALVRSRRALAMVADQAERSRHSMAIDDLAGYVDLLRETTETTFETSSSATVSYTLKLEFADGRWDIAESDLARKPRVGDLLSLEGALWRVRGSQVVRPSVAAKLAREFFVCAPV